MEASRRFGWKGELDERQGMSEISPRLRAAGNGRYMRLARRCFSEEPKQIHELEATLDGTGDASRPWGSVAILNVLDSLSALGVARRPKSWTGLGVVLGRTPRSRKDQPTLYLSLAPRPISTVAGARLGNAMGAPLAHGLGNLGHRGHPTSSDASSREDSALSQICAQQDLISRLRSRFTRGKCTRRQAQAALGILGGLLGVP